MAHWLFPGVQMTPVGGGGGRGCASAVAVLTTVTLSNVATASGVVLVWLVTARPAMMPAGRVRDCVVPTWVNVTPSVEKYAEMLLPTRVTRT